MQGLAAHYAKHRGVTPAAISKAVKEGRITACGKDERGRDIFDFAECDMAWAHNRSPSTRGGNRVDVHDIDVPKRDGVNEGLTFNEARTKREQYQAELARLDYEEKSGKLVDVEKMRQEAFKLARNARDNLLNIPDRVAPLILGAEDLHTIRKVLLEEIHKVCEGLADEH